MSISFMLLFACVSVFSQGSAGRILGTVTDQSGGSVAGATVIVTDVNRNTSRTLTTDQSGEYNAPNLLPGSYRVHAEAKGFKAFERTGVSLEVGGEIRVDLVMQPGEVSQTIVVNEDIPMVETSNAELGGTLQNDIINDIPLNGRNFANLLQLRPGVTIYPGGSGWSQSSNGMRAHDNVYLFEGVNGSDPWMAQPIISAVMAAGDAGTLVSIDAIDEFKTQQNPRAEFGWKPGSIVNVGIKSGTNTMHGTAYAYGRNGSWDALPYFDTPGPNKGIAQTPPPVALEQFGASLGGAIKKDKLFYFVNFEDQRYGVGSTGQITDPENIGNLPIPLVKGVPTPNCLGSPGTGGFSVPTPYSGNCEASLLDACNGVLTAHAADPNVPALSALSLQMAGLNPDCSKAANFPGLFPIVSGANGTSTPNTLSNSNRIDSGLVKINYHLNDQHSISGLYFISPGSGILNDAPGVQTNALWETNQYARSQVFAGSWTWTPNSSWVNEARVGYSHYYQNFESQDAGNNATNYSFGGHTYNINTGQTNPLYYGMPTIVIGSFTGDLGAGWPKIVGPDGILEILDHVSYLRGKHAFKFGAEILYNQSTSNVTANGKGSLTFDSLQGFMMGAPDTAVGGNGGSAAILVGNLARHFTYAGYAGFFQDDWRFNSRVTVNMGLRYELNTVPKERDLLQGNFNPAVGLQQVGSGILSPYNGDHNNFSPRLGFAWDVFGNGKTIVRAAGGILYEQMSLDVFQGIGNSFGLRVEPTGDQICVGGGPTCRPGIGSITVANVSYTSNSTALDGPGLLPGTFASGSIANGWNNNSTSPIFNFSAACGDGATVLPNSGGLKPPQCNAIMVDPNLRTPYVSNWSLGIQRALTNKLSLDVSYVGNHGTKLIGALDLNQPALQTINVPGIGNVVTGPGWTAAALNTCATTSSCKVNSTNETNARPYAAQYPYLKFVDFFGNLDSSTYNGLQVALTARDYHGLTLTTGYTYSHALGESSDQGTSGGLVIPANSYGGLRQQLYTSTTFDMRHRLTISGNYLIPGKKGFGQVLEGWSVNSSVAVSTGTPWGINDTTTDFAGIGEANGRNPQANEGMQWDFYGNPSDFEAVHNFAGVTPGPTGVTGVPFFPGGKTKASLSSPTSNATCNAKATALGPLAVASLNNLGCYAIGTSVLIPPAYGSFGNMGRNPWRDGGFRNVDASVSKTFKFNERLRAEFRAEIFNLFNHPDFVNPYGGPGGAGTPNDINPSKAGTGTGLGYVLNTPDAASSNPVLGSGGPRDLQLGLKLIF
ncbi:MAG TPA: TonB-dependent receptor [Candidatus Saccharimonadales bacterium]|nr:TonB-dependent receptor [Candidatus Saccharimonadales bacterium]